MSNNTETRPAPPEDVVTYAGMPNWRITKGTLNRGREKLGTLETRQKLVGYLKSICIHSGSFENDQGEQEDYTRLECILETSHGNQCVGTDTERLTQTCMLAEGLLECAAGELIAIEARQGAKDNKFGTKSTFVNLFHVDPVTFKTTQIRVERNPSEAGDERRERLLGLIYAHPCYKEREKRESSASGPTHRGELEKELNFRGWPPTTEPEWLPMMNAYHETTKLSLDAFTDDHWGQIRQKLSTREQLPKLLQPAMDRLGEKDPFADESGGGNASALD